MVDDEQQDVLTDNWVLNQYWETIRGGTQKQLSSSNNTNERNFLVKARLVILGGEKRVFLQDDSSLIEISDLIEGRKNIDQCGNHFPRKLVSRLEEGDLIVLRTSGSGDYLLDVAKSLMERRCGTVVSYENAISWKFYLKSALEKYGHEEIGMRLQDAGVSLKNYNYIWMWTTDLIIRPGTKARFEKLINVLNDLAVFYDIPKPLLKVDEWWAKMEEIVHYHRLAGQEIRKSLLERLRTLIEQGVVITDSYSLTLPDVDAGEMSVFRIAGIDPQTIQLPYNDTGIILQEDEPSNDVQS